MMPQMRVALLVAGLLAIPAAAAVAQDFAADLVDLDAAGNRRPLGEGGRLHVAGGRVRLDRERASDSRFLVDVGAGTALVIAPQQRLYMDAKQSSVVTRIFVPVDPEAPCRRWQAMAQVAGVEGQAWRCKRLGEELLGGRATVKYALTAPQAASAVAWIDRALNFPIKLEAADGAVLEARNIVEEPQPEALFTVPREYRKYDPAQLIERVKHSDAWVEPPPP